MINNNYKIQYISDQVKLLMQGAQLQAFQLSKPIQQSPQSKLNLLIKQNQDQLQKQNLKQQLFNYYKSNTDIYQEIQKIFDQGNHEKLQKIIDSYSKFNKKELYNQYSSQQLNNRTQDDQWLKQIKKDRLEREKQHHFTQKARLQKELEQMFQEKQEVKKENQNQKRSKINSQKGSLYNLSPMSIKAQSYLYRKWEENYENNIHLPQLQSLKQQINEKKQQNKQNNINFSIDEIKSHIKKYNEQKAIRQQQKEQQISYECKLELNKKQQFYPSYYYKKVQQDEQKEKELQDLKKKKQYELKQNQRVYSKMVKEVHIPQVKQFRNIESSNQTIDNQILRKSEIYKEYLSELRQRSFKKKSLISANQARRQKDGQQNERKSGGNSIGKNDQQNINRSVDYLTQMRQDRQNKDNGIQINRKVKVGEYEFLKRQAQHIEEQAQRKEQLLKAKIYKYDEDSVLQANEVSAMYMRAIETKLAILNEI